MQHLFMTNSVIFDRIFGHNACAATRLRRAQTFAPLTGRQPCFLLEHAVYLRVRRKAALCRYGIVAVVGASLHHTHSLVEAYVAEPCAEVGVGRLVKIFGQFTLLAAQLGSKRVDGDAALPVLPLVTPFLESQLYLPKPSLRQERCTGSVGTLLSDSSWAVAPHVSPIALSSSASSASSALGSSGVM